MQSLAEQFGTVLAGTATSAELAALEFDWRFWARPNQIAPSDYYIWLLLAGRGFGKTRCGAEAIRQAVYDGVKRIALIGATIGDVRDIMVEGESGIIACFPEHERPVFVPSKNIVKFHTGAIAKLFSSQEPDRLRGHQFEMALCDELAAWHDIPLTWANLVMGLRLGRNPRIIITTTPRPLNFLRDLVRKSHEPRNRIRVTRGNTKDNRANLAPGFVDELEAAYGGTRLGRQELEGEILEPEGGLFRREWLQYEPNLPRFMSVVVSIDPAISTRNDETGICVVGRSGDNAYVLDDLSGRYSPEQWARTAVDAAKRWKASRIVAETNRGGDLVKATIRQFDRSIAIEEVRANRSKDTRAEPVSALYEQLRVFHRVPFEALEQQMLEFSPTSQEAKRAAKHATSPDRLDALVWGILAHRFHDGGPSGFRDNPFARLPSFDPDSDD